MASKGQSATFANASTEALLRKKNQAPVAADQGIRVNPFEVLVETKSAPTLSTISKELGSPTSPKGRRALLSQ